jgi:scyllo-inositol 2-dehydrogenase (NADP+)
MWRTLDGTMPPLTEDILVGLVGFGTAGRVFHAPVIERVPGLRLSAIVQRSSDTAASLHPHARSVRTLDELLADDRIRLVVIATPNATHADLARRCLEAGRHVVVDKPFAVSSAEAAPLIAVARRCERLLTVFHNRRWDGDFLTVQRLIEEQTCGRTVLVESRFERFRPDRRPGSWRERQEPGSGILFDLGSHLVDQAVTLFGPPEAVTGDVRIERDWAVVDDAFDVTLHYPTHRVLLRSSMLASAPGPRFVVRGTSGSYVKYHLDPQEAQLAAGGADGRFWEQEPRERWGTLTRSAGAGTASEVLPTEAGDYRGFYVNVRDAIRGTAALSVTAEQALDVIRLLELARESSSQRRTLSSAFGNFATTV